MTTTPLPLRTCVLRHVPGPEGPPPHFDWLLEPEGAREPDETRDVLTWRCHRRPDRLEPGELACLEPIGHHRRAWLGRAAGSTHALTSTPLGTATVVARGRARIEDAGRGEIHIEWFPSNLETTLLLGADLGRSTSLLRIAADPRRDRTDDEPTNGATT